jgi:hypothetical protein
VLNRGAHYVPDEPFVTNTVRVLAHLLATHPGLTVVVRNTPSGHPHCVPPAPDAQHTSRRDQEYHWDDFPRQNALLRDLLYARFPSVLHVDVAAPTRGRPDRHVSDSDCLHYCSGSVQDHWALLLLNALQVRMSSVLASPLLYLVSHSLT